ncbi:MAG: hypothetical protein VB112_04570 [Oscillospiraceae bacterium]|nr:hypothetical protein [Oscillospiraceae bacterium]
MKRKPHGVSVGSALLIMILAVLCLTIFSVLSLSSANASLAMADRTAEETRGYYAADKAACAILSQILAGDEVAPAATSPGEDGATVYSYSVPIDDGSKLMVDVKVSGQKYDILRWQAENISIWSPDESLNVWDGETEE